MSFLCHLGFHNWKYPSSGPNIKECVSCPKVVKNFHWKPVAGIDYPSPRPSAASQSGSDTEP